MVSGDTQLVTFRHGIWLKFLMIVVPVFLVLSVPGMTLLVEHELRDEHNDFAAQIGSKSARVATMLGRYGGLEDKQLARDLIGTLASDPSFLCAEIKPKNATEPLIAMPAPAGCGPFTDIEPIILPIGGDRDASLTVRFSDAVLNQAKLKRQTLTQLVVGLSFLIAVLASAIAFRLIINRPLNQLLGAIRSATETGERTPLANDRKDEFGIVIGAFNEMQERESAREQTLEEVNDALRKSQTELQELNDELEQRIRERTAKLRLHEEALLESEQRLRVFAEASSDWFWEMDENLRFSYFSDRFEAVTGVPQEKLLGKTREETGIPGVDPKSWQEHLDALHDRRPFRDFTHPRTKDDGSIVWVAISGKPVFDQSGTFKGFCGTGADITKQREMEEELAESRNTLRDRVTQLEEAKAELEAHSASLSKLAADLQRARDEAETANRAKSQFLANMSHEFRTPLNAIIGFSEIIRDETFGPVGDDRYVGYITDIHDSGAHLLALINDLLDLCKIESGEDELHEETVDIEDVLQSVVKLVQNRAVKGGVDLRTELQDGIPELHADRRKFIQIMVNLLSNAVKFTEPGGSVTLKAWCPADSGPVFQVVDTGIGMAPGDIPRALSQFAQVDTDLNRRYEGTGLGLPLTKGLIELHGGSLDLQSALGKGTTATVRFPIHRVVADASPERLRRLAGQRADTDSRSPVASPPVKSPRSNAIH